MAGKKDSLKRSVHTFWRLSTVRAMFSVVALIGLWQPCLAQTRLDLTKSNTQNKPPASQRLQLNSMSSPSQRLCLQATPAEVSQRLCIQQVGEARVEATRPAAPRAPAVVKQHVETPLEKADKVAQRGDFDQALELYKKALNNDPNLSSAYMGRGYIYIQLGNFDGAVQEYQEAIERAPHNVEAKINLGVAFYSRGDINAAIEQYKQVIDKEKASLPIAHYNLAMALAHCGKFPEAIENYQTVIKERKQNYLEALNNLGLIYEAMGNFDSAAKQFQQVINSQSGNPLAHYNLGRQYLRNRDYKQAIAELQSAIRQQPNYPEAYLSLGNVYLLINETDAADTVMDKAIEAFEKAIAQRNNFYPLAHENLAIALARKGDRAASLAHYRLAFDQYGNQSPYAMRNLLFTISQQDEVSIYIIHNEISRPGNPGNLSSRIRAASPARALEIKIDEEKNDILCDEDKKELAIIFNKYENMDEDIKNQIDVRYCMGQAYFVMGDLVNAQEEFAQARKLAAGQDAEVNRMFFVVEKALLADLDL